MSSNGFSYARTKDEPSTNGLKHSSEDPSFPSTDGAYFPCSFLSDNHGPQFYSVSIGDSPTDDPNHDLSTQMQDDVPFDDWLCFPDAEEKSPNPVTDTAARAETVPSRNSFSSATSSEREASSDGSVPPSFSAISVDKPAAAVRRRPRAKSNASLTHILDEPEIPYSSSVDSIMNEMTMNVALDSTKNSPPDTVAMPYQSPPQEALAISISHEASPIEDALGFFPNDFHDGLPDSPGQSPVTMGSSMGDGSMHVNSASARFFPWPITQEQQSSAHSLYQPSATGFSWFDDEQNQPQYLKYVDIGGPVGPASIPTFVVLATKLTTRVETAIGIRLQLRPPPNGISKLRLDEDNFNKYKKFKELEKSPTPDTLILHAMAFNNTRIKTSSDVEAALKRAASPESRTEPSIDGTETVSDDGRRSPRPALIERTCDRCRKREALRCNRGGVNVENREEAPGADKMVLFNDPAPIIEWKTHQATSARDSKAPYQGQGCSSLRTGRGRKGQDKFSAKDKSNGKDKKKKNGDDSEKLPTPPVDPGTCAVDLKMRVCCYCRHQGDDCDGFRIVLTLKYSNGDIYGQRMTEPVMITDDHKDKEKKENMQQEPSIFGTPHTDGRGQFIFGLPAPLQQSQSVPDFTAMGPHSQQSGFMLPSGLVSPPYSMICSPYASNRNSLCSQTGSGAATSETRSRPASPTRLLEGPSKKRRGVRAELQMTSMTSMTGGHQAQASHVTDYSLGTPFNAPAVRRTPVHHFSNRSNRRSNVQNPRGSVTNPPSPNHGGYGPFSGLNESHSITHAAQANSMPTSNHQSRGHSPGSGLQGQAMNSQSGFLHQVDQRLSNVQPSNAYVQPPNPQGISSPTPQPGLPHLLSRHQPIRQVEVRHMDPDSGPLSGGGLCSLFGENFYPGMKVIFGNRQSPRVASPDSYSLQCEIPHGERLGPVQVQIIHPCPPQSFSQVSDQPIFYTYTGGDRSERSMLQISHTMFNPQQHYEDQSPFQPYTNGNTGPYQQYPTFPQFSHASHSAQEMPEPPPAYHATESVDEQRGRNIKIGAVFRAAADTYEDEKARQLFDTVSEKTAAIPRRSKSLPCVIISRDGISEEEKQELRLERSRNIVELSEDKKLWWGWLPTLISILACWCYFNCPQVGGWIITVLAWILDMIIHAIRAPIQALGHIPGRLQHLALPWFGL